MSALKVPDIKISIEPGHCATQLNASNLGVHCTSTKVAHILPGSIDSLSHNTMNINEITEEQKEDILYHFRAAVLARALQWDHERAIEKMLGREINTDVQDWSINVYGEARNLEPADLTYITWDEIKEELQETP
jgi:hypothetical protein